MALFQWIGLSYFMRGEFYKLKSMIYVKSARALGVGPIGILFGQILPNALTPVITILPFSVIGGISSLTALDFLGLAFPRPLPPGVNCSNRDSISVCSLDVAISTVLAIFITLMLTTFIGEGTRDALTRNRRTGLSNTLLHVEDLSVGFRLDQGTVAVTDSVSFDIYEGEVFGLAGESGCGKTITALAIVAPASQTGVHDFVG